MKHRNRTTKSERRENFATACLQHWRDTSRPAISSITGQRITSTRFHRELPAVQKLWRFNA